MSWKKYFLSHLPSWRWRVLVPFVLFLLYWFCNHKPSSSLHFPLSVRGYISKQLCLFLLTYFQCFQPLIMFCFSSESASLYGEMTPAPGQCYFTQEFYTHRPGPLRQQAPATTISSHLRRYAWYFCFGDVAVYWLHDCIVFFALPTILL